MMPYHHDPTERDERSATAEDNRVTRKRLKMIRRFSSSILAALIAALPFALAACDLSADVWDERVLTVEQNEISAINVTDQEVDLSQHPEIADKLKQLKDLTSDDIWLEITSSTRTTRRQRARAA